MCEKTREISEGLLVINHGPDQVPTPTGLEFAELWNGAKEIWAMTKEEFHREQAVRAAIHCE